MPELTSESTAAVRRTLFCVPRLVRLPAMIASQKILVIAWAYSSQEDELYHRTRIFSANEYSTLLGTYSDHIAIEESIRKKFFSKIEDAINSHGGSITLYDTIDLQLARKP